MQDNNKRRSKTMAQKKKEEAQAEAPVEIIPGGLTTNCMLMKLSINCWYAARKDKEVINKAGIAVSDNNRKNWVRGYRTLLDPGRIREMANKEVAIRDYVNVMTMPWKDGGKRLLPAALFETVNTKVHELTDDFNECFQKLYDDYYDLIRAARSQMENMGLTFDLSQYPSKADLPEKYKVYFGYEPVPTSGDLRVSIQTDELQRIKAEMDDENKAATERAMANLWIKIYEVANNMAVQLSKDKPKIFDSLVNNALNLVNLLPNLNWNNNLQLEKARGDLEKKLCAHNTEKLRGDDAARKETAKAAEELAQTAANMMTQLDPDLVPPDKATSEEAAKRLADFENDLAGIL